MQPPPLPPSPPAACEQAVSRTSLAAFSGRRVRSLDVVSVAPPPLPGVAAPASRLHVRTRPGTVRRLMLVVPGDTVDTLRVAESLRRMRRQRYLGDASVAGRSCPGDDGAVRLTVTTHDEWSAKGTLQLRANASQSLAVTERNLLGTGRELSLAVRQDAGRTGLGASLVDPWFLGTRLRAELSRTAYADGGAWDAALATAGHDARDRWRAGVRLLARTRTPDAADQPTVRQGGVQALAARRVGLSDAAALAVQAGAEGERTRLVAGPDAPVLGPGTVRRDFRGVDVGLARRALRYDTLTWLVPGARIVDVPLALEGDGVVGLGRDAATGRPAVHVDAWMGRAWLPGARSLLAADLWSDGYVEGRGVEAGSLRGTLAGWRAVGRDGRGLWSARLSAERLVHPDPTVRALETADPTARALPDAARLAGAAVAAQVERSTVLRPLTRSWALGGAAFVAGSLRWQPAAPGSLRETEQVAVGAVGAGIGLTPAKAGRGGARLDVVLPVAAPAGVRRAPYVTLSLTPWFLDGRQRPGAGPRR